MVAGAALSNEYIEENLPLVEAGTVNLLLLGLGLATPIPNPNPTLTLTRYRQLARSHP